MTKPENPKKRIFDLEERTAKFGEIIIGFAQDIPRNVVTTPLISQLVRSATSIGANYCEADDARTKKDFLYKINTCRQESRETKHWLRMVAKAVPKYKEETNKYRREAQELNLIFASIIRGKS